MSSTWRTVIGAPSLPISVIAWSSRDRPSRTEPSAARTISASASGSIVIRSLAAMPARCGVRSGASTRRRSNRWQRESTVTGTLRTSVVAKMKIACGGGSSKVFSRPLKAFSESMWTSSMI